MQALDECLNELKKYNVISINLLDKSCVEILVERGFAVYCDKFDYGVYNVRITEEGRKFRGFVYERKCFLIKVFEFILGIIGSIVAVFKLFK